MSTCEAKRDFHFASTPADYTLVYQHTANIDVSGHHVIKLQNSEKFQTKPGDVIGWSYSASAASGAMAYGMIPDSSNDAPEYQYPVTTQVGSKVLRANGVKVNSHHIVSAHYSKKASFVLYHTFSNTGAYLVTSTIMPSFYIYADVPISGVQLTCPTLTSTNISTVIKIPAHTGSNTTYEWLPGDHRNATTTTIGEYSLVYPKPGIYTFSFAAYNSLGRITKTCIVRAFDKISGLKFDMPVDAVALGQDAVIAWSVEHGTNVSYVVDLGDGSPKMMQHMSGKFQSKMTVRYKYHKVGRYNITIEASSIVSPLVIIMTTAVVQIPLKNLIFITNLPHVNNYAYIARNEVVVMSTQLEQGSNPLCTYKFADGTSKHQTSMLTVNHVYGAVGEYRANVTCMNDISVLHASLGVTIVVQELQEIKNMVVQAKPTALGNETLLSLQMETGTVYMCEWEFGDGSQRKTDFKLNAMPIRHMYDAIGDFIVKVTCTNVLGSQTANVTVSVEIPITGHELQCPNKFMKVGQPFTVKSSTKTGSRLDVTFDFGKDEPTITVSENVNRSLLASHVFNNPGMYSIQVIVKNKFSSIKSSCPSIIKVEHPVTGIRIVTNSPIRYSLGIAEYHWFQSPGFVVPTDAVISWDFGDGYAVNRIPVNFSNLSEIITTHKYNSTGVFITKVKVENSVSSIGFDLEIDVQKMLPVSLIINSKDRQTENMVPGYGPKNNVFPLEQDLQLSVTKQLKDKWYFINFGNGKTTNTTSEKVTYSYPQPGRYNVSVIVENVLKRTTLWKIIVLQESIQGLSLDVPSTIHLKTMATFKIIPKSIGSSACYILSLGDGNVTVFNSTQCENLVRYTINKYVFKPLPSHAFSYNHTYTAKGGYNVSLEAKNLVSYKKLTKQIEIIYKPCAMPSVYISGGGSLPSPRTILRSDRIILRANVTFDCDKASHILYTWSILKASIDSNGQPKLMNFTTTRVTLGIASGAGRVDPTIYEILEKSLDIGISVAKLKVTFESATHDVTDVYSSNAVWLNTVATPLKAVIKGKIFETYSFNSK